MSHWKLLPPISASMSFQMALDELLFRARESQYLDKDLSHNDREDLFPPPILRFYFSDRLSSTVGYSHRGAQTENGVEVVRRITGGGKVDHGRDLVFSLIAHKSHDESFGSVRVSYWKIHEALKKGFESLGMSPRFYRCDESLPEGPECFRYPISSDLALGRKKIAGGSQKRSAGTLLHQESIVVPKSVDVFMLCKAVRAGFESIFEVSLEDSFLKPEWFENAADLSKEKYQPLVINSF